MSHDEDYPRIPTLETALAYEAIYGRPLRDLFAGLDEQIKREVSSRANILSHRKCETPVSLVISRGQKHELAVTLAKILPVELATRLPRKRRFYDSEDGRMDMFEAVAVAFAFRRISRSKQFKSWAPPQFRL